MHPHALRRQNQKLTGNRDIQRVSYEISHDIARSNEDWAKAYLRAFLPAPVKGLISPQARATAVPAARIRARRDRVRPRH